LPAEPLQFGADGPNPRGEGGYSGRWSSTVISDICGGSNEILL
jgi:hypothetical protein